MALQHADLIEELIVIDMALVLYQEPFLDYIKAMQEALERREAEDRNRRGARLGGARCRHPTVPNAEPGGAQRQAQVADQPDAIAANMDSLLGFPDVSAHEYDGRALFVSGARSDYIGHTYHGQILPAKFRRRSSR